MDYKKEIQELLIDLKKFKKDRRTIEKELYMSPKSIDQLLSRGGNKEFYVKLQDYRKRLLEATSVEIKKEDRALLKALVHHYAKRVAKQDGVPLKDVLDDLAADTMLIMETMK